ncbi:MAG TPA: hypothetical protein VFE62_00475 [Gemmataceae bacterium]|nr:hypothetical protein [Gemmataceae bacterium]
MGWSRAELSGYVSYHDVTKSLLDDLETHSFKWKRVREFHFIGHPGGAWWRGISEEVGDIYIHVGCEPGAIAHELGHGFEECLRHRSHRTIEFSEDYAEAIRWFAEQREGPSSWCNEYRGRSKKHDAILKECRYDWARFVDNLKRGHFFP